MKKWICKIFGHKKRIKQRDPSEWRDSKVIVSGCEYTVTNWSFEYCARLF